MTSRALVRKKKEDTVNSRKDKSSPAEDTKCPIFPVQYLGKMPAKGEYGREFISEPVEALVKMKSRQLRNAQLTITEKGFHFLDSNGPFGKEKHVLIPIHHICYGVADEHQPRVFAIITRTDSNPDSSLFECHAFFCEKKKTSSEITYWLLKTFLQVFEGLQEKRRQRQERKERRMKMLAREGGSINNNATMQRNTNEKLVDMAQYSVILDRSKTRGTAVGLSSTRKVKRKSINGPSSPSHAGAPHDNNNYIQDLHFLRNSESIGTVKRNPLFDTPLNPQFQSSQSTNSSLSSVTGARVNAQVYVGASTPPVMHPKHYRYPKMINDPPDYDQSPPISPETFNRSVKINSDLQSSGRYVKNQSSGSKPYGLMARNTLVDQVSFSDSWVNNSVHNDSDFFFIQMLQEEFSDNKDESVDTFSVVSGKPGQNSPYGPPNQRLRGEDIERRIKEWLLDYDESEADRPEIFRGDLLATNERPAYRRTGSFGDSMSIASSGPHGEYF